MNFIPIFYDQLTQFPIDFFRDELSKNNFICPLIKRLRSYSKGKEYSSKISKRIDKLLGMIKNKFDFEVYSEEDE